MHMGHWQSIFEIAEKVRSGEESAVNLVQKSLAAIHNNKKYHAVIATEDERAVARAKGIDQEVKEGKQLGRLAGVPFIAKDNFLTFGTETTAASNILRGFQAPYQATAIEKLEAEGAICVAKANLDAFAHGSSTENSDFFTTLNPFDQERVAGGSSGGSAAAVALGMAPFALGTDTGGSIRQPAAFCGVVGLKPTYGLVSRSGVIAMASSTDVIGPIANSVDDAALVLDVIAGRDPLDSTTIERDHTPYNEYPPSKKYKIGVVKEYFEKGLNPDIKKIIESQIEGLSDEYEVVPVSLPSLSLALAVYYVVMPAEVSSNLSRYDGQRFGYSDKSAKNLEESYTYSRSVGFGKEAKRRIIMGTFVSSTGYYDAYYKRAQIVRTKLIKEFKKAFNKVDFLIGPTTPSIAFEVGKKVNDPLEMYLNDVMTVAANLVGVPAISIPVGFVNKLPVGLQVMASQGDDRALLGLAHDIEQKVKI